LPSSRGGGVATSDALNNQFRIDGVNSGDDFLACNHTVVGFFIPIVGSCSHKIRLWSTKLDI